MEDLSLMFAPLNIFDKTTGYCIYDELKNYSKDILPILAKYNWFISPSLDLTIHYYIFKNINEQSDVESFLNKVFVYYFSAYNFGYLDNLIGRWGAFSTVGDRLLILEECVSLLKDSESKTNNIKNPHYVIIPALIAQIDGLKSDIIEHYKLEKVYDKIKENRKISEKECICEIFEKIYSTEFRKSAYPLINSWFLEGSNNANDLLFDVLFQTAYRTQKIEELKPPFSRHKIMHGQHLGYANIENTIRLFLLIDFLSELNYLLNKNENK
jgi:hypothetical protein